MRRAILFLFALAAAMMLVPTSAVADPNNESLTFALVMQGPNFGVAPNGDRVKVTCQTPPSTIPCGTFSVHPKAVEASGDFEHTNSTGTVLASGTWTATDLLSFEFYGCGVVTGPDPDLILPANFCGGTLKLRVLLTAGGSTFDGILTVFCVIGPQSPESHDNPFPPELEEGVALNVPGVINFNHENGGMNRYELIS